MYEYTIFDVKTQQEYIIHGHTYCDALRRCNMEDDPNFRILLVEYID